MAIRRMIGRIPIWGRVLGAIVIVLAAVLPSTTRRNQVVNASPLFLSSSSSFSAGVFHPSVSRGRPLSLSAISSKSS